MMFFVCVCLLTGTVALAINYQADFVQKTSGMGMPLQGKIYVKDKKMRMDMEMNGQRTSFITGGDKVYMVQHNQKMAMIMPNQQPGSGMMGVMPQAIPDQSEFFGKGKVLKKGLEEINGIICEKVFCQDGPQKITIWFARKLGLPMKMVAEGPDGKSVMEYKNVKIGQVKDNVFAVPAGYTIMHLPGMGTN